MWEDKLNFARVCLIFYSYGIRVEQSTLQRYDSEARFSPNCCNPGLVCVHYKTAAAACRSNCSRKSQSEMIEKLSTVLHKLPDPDIRHTWAQAPVRFEDALGRIIPIPSEYDWDVSWQPSKFRAASEIYWQSFKRLENWCCDSGTVQTWAWSPKSSI
jgi:hypothetical protein